MANRQRGEVTIKLDGKKYAMRPTFEALCEIEDALDTDIPYLINQFSKGRVRLKVIVVVLYEGIKSGGELVSKEEIGEILIREGLVKVLESEAKPIAKFLSVGLTGITDDAEEETGNVNSQDQQTQETE